MDNNDFLCYVGAIGAITYFGGPGIDVENQVERLVAASGLKGDDRDDAGAFIQASFLSLGLGFRVEVIWGIYRDNGKENGSYYLGFRV